MVDEGNTLVHLAVTAPRPPPRQPDPRESVDPDDIADLNQLIRIVKAQVHTMMSRWRVQTIDGLDEDDLCQEILVFITRDGAKVLRSHDESRGPLTGFIRVVVTNRLRDVRRRHRRRLRILGEPVDAHKVYDLRDESPEPERRVAARRAVDRIHRCLTAKLKPHILRAFLMRVCGDCSYREIAELEGVSEATINSRIYLARKVVGRCARLCGLSRGAQTCQFACLGGSGPQGDAS